MDKINKSLACLYCHADGLDISYSPNDEVTKDKQDKVTLVNIKRTYNCHCKKCNNSYQVDYGVAKLRRYKPYTSGTCIGDVRVYVRYESEFDRSYTIADVQGVMMMLVEEDDYPIIIDRKEVDTLLSDHKKAKEKVNNRWMSRYR